MTTENDDHWIYGVALKDGSAEPVMTFMRMDQATEYLKTLDNDEYHIVVRGDQQFYGTPGIHQFMH